MVVQKTSVFPASRETVFENLRKLETLQYIASPFATFEPEGDAAVVWEEGSESSYRFRLFGMIQYTDRVEIQAGWKTLFIWLWANMFYTHRQRKWIRLLQERNEKGDNL